MQRNVTKSVNVVLLIKLSDLLTFPLPSLSWYWCHVSCYLQVKVVTYHAKRLFCSHLVNPFRLGPAKMPVILQLKQYAMRCCSSHGPVFGGGTVGDVHDLFISDNANTNTISSSHLGKTYQWPQEGQQFLFTGGPKFTVTDYEVFGLYQ